MASAGSNPDPVIQKDENQAMKPDQSAQNSQNATNDSEKIPALKTLPEQINYAIGVNLIGNFKQQGIDVDLNLVTKGMQDALSGGKLLLNDAELRKATMLYQAEARRRQAEARAAAAENNRKEGKAIR